MKDNANDSTFDRIISERIAAEILGLSADTLRRLGRRGKGPERRKMSSRRVGYKLSEVEAYRDGRLPLVARSSVQIQTAPQERSRSRP
jgi:predicted DNA-binding transcriptional regulator AlpA